MSAEPYVADPAETPRRAALTQRVPLIVGLLVIVTLLAVGLLLFTRGATEDPSIGGRPSPAATPSTGG